MSLKGILRSVLTRFLKYVDVDNDGRLEISDLPGAMAKMAAQVAEGQALIDGAEGFLGALLDLAKSGKVTSGGAPVTPEQLREAFARAKALPVEAGDLARAELMAGG